MSDPHHPPWLLKIIRTDWVLAVALCVGLLFSVYGMTWGSGQSWHPDEMAFRGLFSAKTLPFEPMSFNRPPFHTYFNYFLSVLPFDLLQQTASKLVGSPVNLGIVRLYWSKMLTVFLFLGSIALAYHITQRYFGRFAARSLALLIATSAGLVVEAHFLTADMPVLFWMLVGFYFVQNISLRGQRSDYILWAGFFIGIATATKYNGLAVVIALPIAHLLRPGPRYWKQVLSDEKIYLSLGMVVVGFVAGNPFALFNVFKVYRTVLVYLPSNSDLGWQQTLISAAMVILYSDLQRSLACLRYSFWLRVSSFHFISCFGTFKRTWNGEALFFCSQSVCFITTCLGASHT